MPALAGFRSLVTLVRRTLEDEITRHCVLFDRMPPKSKYTCNDYREEMRLLGLKNRLNEKNLSETEKQAIEAEITKLEKALRMD